MAVELQATETHEEQYPVIATDVSLEDYMEYYAENFCEWVEGTVIKLSPVHLSHEKLVAFLRVLLAVYFELRPVGTVISQPFVMRLPAFPKRRREPDLMVVLHSNPGTLTNTFMDGPADLVIEIVSPDSAERDHGEKFIEYEKGGVGEYWIIDPLRTEPRFYRLDERGLYMRQNEDADGNYRTSILPGLVLHVPTLWHPHLPGPLAIGDAVRTMLQGAE